MSSNEEDRPDEKPISPIERRDSLEKHLQHRPDPQELKDKHILLDINAAPSVMSFEFPYSVLELHVMTVASTNLLVVLFSQPLTTSSDNE